MSRESLTHARTVPQDNRICVEGYICDTKKKQELYGAHTPCALQFIESSFIGYVTIGSFV